MHAHASCATAQGSACLVWHGVINGRLTVCIPQGGQPGQLERAGSGRGEPAVLVNGPPDTPEAADPLSQFDMVCLDATTGAPTSLRNSLLHS